MKNQIDAKELAAGVELPYRVPVDFIVRFFLLMVLAIMGFALYTCLQNPKETTTAEWIFMALGLLAALLIFLRPSGLVIREDGIEHLKFFFIKRYLPWHEIEKVVTGTQDTRLVVGTMPTAEIKGTLGKVDSSAGPYLMIFFSKNNPKPFLLNIKPYTKKGLMILVHFLAQKAPHAALDEPTRDILKGVMPSLFFPHKHQGHS